MSSDNYILPAAAPRSPNKIYAVQQVDPTPLTSQLVATELNFYRSYPWCLNVFPTVQEIQGYLRSELSRLGEVPEGWQRTEIATNIFLLSCAVTDAVDDYLLGRRYNFAKAIEKLPLLKRAAPVAEGILSLRRKYRELGHNHLRNWRQSWNAAVVEFLGAFLANDPSDEKVFSAHTAKLASLLAKQLPTDVLARRPRAPAAFLSQDLTHLDAVALARKFVAAFPDRNCPVLVLGLRTAGSYFAPVVHAYLKSEGYQHVDSATLRPKRGISSWEAARLARCASSGGLAVIVDEPCTTGYTVAKAVKLIHQAGLGTHQIVALLPTHPTLRNSITTPEYLSACQITVLLLEREEWHKRSLLELRAIEPVVQEYFLGRGYRSATLGCGPRLEQLSGTLKNLCVEKGHIRFKRISEVRLRDSAGKVETRYVLAKSIGWGWFSYHAFLVADRLSPYLPPVLGLRNGIMFTEWLPESHELATTICDRDWLVSTLASYVAARVGSLALGKDPSPDLIRENWHRGLDLLAGALTRAYRNKIVAALKRGRIRKRLSHMGAPCPTLIDGKMRRVEWIRGPAGLLKTDFAHHGLGKTELNLTDPAYDLAEAILYWDLSPAEENSLLTRYVDKCRDTDARKRLLVHKLLAGTWAMTSALEHLENPRLLHRHADFHQQYVEAWNFLTIHTARLCGSLCRRPENPRWHAPLVVLDIDGVLDDRIFGFPSTTAAGIRAVSLLHAHDFGVAVNTARSVREVQEYCKAYGFLGGVAEYGSTLWDAVGNRELVLVSPESLSELERVKSALRQIPGVFLNETYRYSIRAYSFEDDRTVPLPTPVIQGLLAKLGTERLQFHQTSVDTAVLGRDINKGTGLRSLLAWVGMPELDTVAIGDSETDLTMFRVAKRSFAPAQIECRELAQLLGCQITDRPYQAGLLRIVRSLIHPQGGRCEHCRSTQRPWPKGKDVFLDLLELADKRGRVMLLGALLDPMSLGAFTK